MKDLWRAAAIALVAIASSAGTALYLGMSQPGEPQPRDGRAWVLAARAHMDAGRYPDAAEAYRKGLEASRKVARDPQVWCEMADAVGMAQGGSLRGRPGELIGRALTLDPHHARALEMAGSAAYEKGEYAQALSHWQQLLAQLPPGSQAHAELSAAIARTRSM